MAINRRDFITTALAATAIAAAPKVSQAQPKRPNILFILADDLGYGDLSCYGRPDYETPNLDRLAAQGLRFANAYSAAPLCTPTRCAFITGRYPARTLVGLEEPLTEKGDLGERAKVLGLPPEHPTIASLLKQSGYQTSLIGKWHLGYLPNFGPIQSGFDEFFGIMSGAADFFTHKDMRGDNDLYEGKVPVERIGYTTEMLTQRAVEYLSQRRANPFYLSLHYTAPHWPWEGPRDQEVSRTLGKGYDGFTAGGSLKTYAAMMKSLDDGIGKVLRALDRSGLTGNTLVIFTSDNGGERFSYNWPFRGDKGDLWEGGIRVPAIVRWSATMSNVQRPMSKVGEFGSRSSDGMRSVPGAVATGFQEPGSHFAGSNIPIGNRQSAIGNASGRIIQDVAITMDWTATMLAVAGAKPDPNYPLDGIDLMPTISAASPRLRVPASPRPPLSVSPRLLFWRSSRQDAVLHGRWKYLRDGEDEYLFDLSTDEREQANFREQNPAMFTRLRDEFKKWNATVLPRPPRRRF
ncbi:MAG TPA: sulfatase-like hydrolase/transferase [Pyrinomonadaceae bacterium]|nr:sulfatase-like hydrolase/transferase [Pyrinomonadaceae bacterium]